MGLEENKNVVRAFLGAWAAGDTGTLRSLLHEEVISYHPVTGEQRGIDFEVGACETWHAAFDEVQIGIVQMVAEGDKVTAHWTMTSTHARGFMGIAPTGEHVTVPGFEISRVVDGKIAEVWRLSDTMSLMGQLGAL